MHINWLKEGEVIKQGLEEGSLELDFFPGIPLDVIFNNAKPQTPTDEEERSWLLDQVDEILPRFRNDFLTREGLFYNLHQSELPVNCINLFHFEIRRQPDWTKYCLNLFVYVRSMNVKNLGYDLITVDQIYRKMFDLLKLENIVINDQVEDLQIGKIKIKIESLHYYDPKSS